MSKTRLRVRWRPFGLSETEQRERTLAYALGIRDLHPLLSEFSWKGEGGSYKKMLTYPNIWDMPDELWRKSFDRHPDWEYHSHEYWNRRSVDRDSFLHKTIFNKILDPSRLLSMMVTSGIPDLLLNEDILMRWLEVAITAFDAEIGEIATFETGPSPDRKLVTPLWRCWLKDGASVNDVGFLDPEQTMPYSSEAPWLDGTLYTWPEFAPWTLLNQRSILFP